MPYLWVEMASGLPLGVAANILASQDVLPSARMKHPGKGQHPGLAAGLLLAVYASPLRAVLLGQDIGQGRG